MNSYLDDLRVGLRKAIQEWMDAVCEDSAWEGLDTYVANDTALYMADAAIQVLAAQAALSKMLRDDYGVDI
jgi:hypothetical protein